MSNLLFCQFVERTPQSLIIEQAIKNYCCDSTDKTCSESQSIFPVADQSSYESPADICAQIDENLSKAANFLGKRLCDFDPSPKVQNGVKRRDSPKQAGKKKPTSFKHEKVHRCPYHDCDKSYGMKKSLYRHIRQCHADSDLLKEDSQKEGSCKFASYRPNIPRGVEIAGVFKPDQAQKFMSFSPTKCNNSNNLATKCGISSNGSTSVESLSNKATGANAQGLRPRPQKLSIDVNNQKTVAHVIEIKDTVLDTFEKELVSPDTADTHRSSIQEEKMQGNLMDLLFGDVSSQDGSDVDRDCFLGNQVDRSGSVDLSPRDKFVGLNGFSIIERFQTPDNFIANESPFSKGNANEELYIDKFTMRDVARTNSPSMFDAFEECVFNLGGDSVMCDENPFDMSESPELECRKRLRV